jgi:hypothetical protein
MSNNYFAITPTGCRPEGLALLAEYLDAQTHPGPLIWIVVDDCDPPTRVPRTRAGITVELVRPDWRWEPGENTQARCMAEGLKWVGFEDRVMVLEDDDIYLPGHVSNVLSWLERAELVGERDSRYYNVATSRWRVLPGKYHASMCSVACKGAATDHLLQLCQGGGKMLDMRLWRTFNGPKKLLDTHNVIGIKGLPGRPGIGVGHRRNFGTPDMDDHLRVWAGEYADNYDIFRRAA